MSDHVNTLDPSSDLETMSPFPRILLSEATILQLHVRVIIPKDSEFTDKIGLGSQGKAMG